MKVDARLERQIAALSDLSRDELAVLWEKQYGCPPKGIKRGLLERSAAWHLQAKRLGGLSPAAKRVLKAAEKGYLARHDARRSVIKDSNLLADGSGSGANSRLSHDAGSSDVASRIQKSKPAAPSPIVAMPSPGSRLLREWNGRMYAVDVLEKGFVMDGRTYRSLSAVAKRITGTDWSGPRFFGL